MGGFTAVWALRNGTLLFATAVNTNSVMSYGVSQFDSTVTASTRVCPGDCSLTGGTCVNGKCYCVSGCTGENCKGGLPFCSAAAVPGC